MTATSGMRLRYVFSVTSGGTPAADDEHWGGDIPWVTPEDLTARKGYWLTDTRRKITRAGYAASGTTMAPANSVVLSKRAPIGQVALLGVPACSSQGCYLLVPKTASDSRFFYYWLSCQTEYLQVLGSGSTFMELGADDLRSVRVPNPPLSQQRSVANYLDHETARLDSLAAQQQRILRLLAEKRQAVISHAVTRGVDPDVPMRDSGISWLGPIPRHWQVERARWLFRERDERTTTGDEELLTVSHLTGVTPRADKTVNMFLAETMEGYKLASTGDLVINTLWAWMGAMGVSPLDGIVSPAYNVYRPTDALEAGYVDALVRSPSFAQEVSRHSKGVWSSRLRLYPEEFFNVVLPVPPRAEQNRIVRLIETEVRKLDGLQVAVENAAGLIEERRAALIAAAVTGQIEVRSGA